MSFKKNVAASYASQAYVALVGIVIIPLYLKYMGAEAYGLVGFYTMLQTWFSVLDIGLTPTMARETARLRGGAVGLAHFHQLFRSLRWLFLLVACVGAIALSLLAPSIATRWLNIESLPIDQVIYAIRMMAIIVALRWMSGLYRGVVTGSERLVWLGAYNVAAATMKSVGALPVLMVLGGRPSVFFTYQAFVALTEFAILLMKAHRLVPDTPVSAARPLSFIAIRSILKFSLTLAATSSIWTVVTQADKLILSKLLPLTDFGYFSLAVVVASGVTVVSGPVAGVVMSRMSKLEAEGAVDALLRVYSQTTQLVTVTAVSSALTVSAFAAPLIAAWTGHTDTAAKVAPILIPYALGNAILAMCAFPYYLQYAKGNLRLHVIGSVLFLATLVPTVMWAAPRYGGVGAGYAWLATNVVFFLAWIPYVHHLVHPGVHRGWMLRDILPSSAACVCIALLANGMKIDTSSRFLLLVEVAATGVLMLVSGALMAPAIRARLRPARP